MNNINYEVKFKEMLESFFSEARSVFVIQDNTITVVYAKNPISTYVGQVVKINRRKDIIDFIKRFAIPGSWSIIEDLRNMKTYKVMKKGKRLIQLPIQSLNSKHTKKFYFDIDEEIFKYYLNDQDID